MARTRREKFATGKAISEGAIVVANAQMRATAEAITSETLTQLLEGLKDHKNTRDLGRLCVVLRTMVPYVGKLKDATVPDDGEQPRTFEDLKQALSTLPPAQRRELAALAPADEDFLGGALGSDAGFVEPPTMADDPLEDRQPRVGPNGKKLNQWGVESDDPEVGGPHPAVFEDI